MKILVVEDDRMLNKSICTMLKPLAETNSAYNGADGLFEAQQNIYDLVVLDVMMPEMDGFTVLSELRKTSKCPVLMLTAKGQLNDKVKGLNGGADDYMTKPFYRDEFLARVEALLRRYNNNFATMSLSFKDLSFDLSQKRVMLAGKPLDLIGKSYDILEYLVRNKNIIIPKEQLFNRIWGFDSETIESVVEVYVSNLRKTLKSVDYAKYLRTIRNVGYMWSDEPDE